MFNRIDIVSIPVSDQAAAKHFYVDLLGFEVIRENPMGPDQQWVELAPQGAETSITLVTWFDSMPPGSIILTTKGVEIGSIESAPWGNFATFSDPDNNGLVLQQSAS